MPGKRISDLTPISGAGTANSDDLLIFDTDASETKRISRSQLAEGMQADLATLAPRSVATRTALKALDTSFNTSVYLTEAGREGVFVFRSGDYSSEVTADTQEGIYIASDSIAATSGAWVRQYDGPVLVTWFGVTGDGSTDDGAAINAALASGVKSILIPEGTFVTGQTLLIPTGVTIRGLGERSIIKADAGLDAPIFQNTSGSTGSESDIFLYDFSIDGNKSNQTPLAEVTGIKLLKVARARVHRMHIYNTEGHGIHMNNQSASVEGQQIVDCIIRSPGSSNVGTYGSCIAVTNGIGVLIANNVLTDSAKAGLRISGTKFSISNNNVLRNGNGGLVPVSGEFSDSSVSGGVYADSGPYDNNDGIRLVGVDGITISGVTCRGNAGAGLMALNGCTRISVVGGTFCNNGQNSDAITATTGKDGITIKDEGTGNTNITISGAVCYDDQGTETQDYGIKIEDSSDYISVFGCDLRDNQTAPFFCDASGDNILINNANGGVSTRHLTIGTTSVTATTDETTLATTTITGGSVTRKMGLRITAAGTMTGTADTKTLRLKIGSSSTTVASSTGATGDWSCEAEVWFNSVSSQRLWARTGFQSNYNTSSYNAASEDFSSDVAVALTAQLADGADQIDIRLFSVTPIF